jgi:hypothetical protein
MDREALKMRKRGRVLHFLVGGLAFRRKAALPGTLLGCTGILIHSFVDFNLQIPATAALFYVLCTTAAADTQFETKRLVRRPARAAPMQSWAERKNESSTL